MSATPKRIALGNYSTDPIATNFRIRNYIEKALWIMTTAEIYKPSRYKFDEDVHIIINKYVARLMFVTNLLRSIRFCTHCLNFYELSLESNIIACLFHREYVCNECVTTNAKKPFFKFDNEKCSMCGLKTLCTNGCYEPWSESCNTEIIYRFSCNTCKILSYRSRCNYW